MKLDINKVNLLERDIEDWLYANPQVLDDDFAGTHKWIGRQFQLPSGIADLIGVKEDGSMCVVEIKNVAINKAAVLQVCRYAADLECIVGQRMDYPMVGSDNMPTVERILIGPSIDGQTFNEARACHVRVIQFSASLHLDLSPLRWNLDHQKEVDEKYADIAKQDIFDIYGEHIHDHIERMEAERRAAGQVDFAIEDVWGAAVDEAIEAVETEE